MLSSGNVTVNRKLEFNSGRTRNVEQFWEEVKIAAVFPILNMERKGIKKSFL